MDGYQGWFKRVFKTIKKYMSKVHLSSRVTAIYRNDDFVEIDLDNGSKQNSTFYHSHMISTEDSQ